MHYTQEMITHMDNERKTFTGSNGNEFSITLKGSAVKSVKYTIVQSYSKYFLCSIDV